MAATVAARVNLMLVGVGSDEVDVWASEQGASRTNGREDR